MKRKHHTKADSELTRTALNDSKPDCGYKKASQRRPARRLTIWGSRQLFDSSDALWLL